LHRLPFVMPRRSGSSAAACSDRRTVWVMVGVG
jgi:hypothetical protein